MWKIRQRRMRMRHGVRETSVLKEHTSRHKTFLSQHARKYCVCEVCAMRCGVRTSVAHKKESLLFPDEILGKLLLNSLTTLATPWKSTITLRMTTKKHKMATISSLCLEQLTVQHINRTACSKFGFSVAA